MKEVESGEERDVCCWLRIRSVSSIADRRLVAVLGITVMVKISEEFLAKQPMCGSSCPVEWNQILSSVENHHRLIGVVQESHRHLLQIHKHNI